MNSPTTDLTPVELAATLRVSTRTLRKLIKLGRLPGVYRIGKRYRIRREALDQIRGLTQDSAEGLPNG